MSKYLLIGDPHIEAHDLEDANRLKAYVLKIIKDTGARPILLGDLYNNHAIINAEVQRFWYDFFNEINVLGETAECIVIAGNHDLPGTTNSQASALLAHDTQAQIVLYPRLLSNNFEPIQNTLFISYQSDPKEFVRICQDYPNCPLVICHQTFNGAQYENGFYAGEGINPDDIPQTQVISGHVHSAQSFGKVWYPGSPRWRYLSDANQDKNLWLVTIENSQLISKIPYSMTNICNKIIHLVDDEHNPLDITPLPLHSYRIDIKGTQQYIDSRKPIYANWARVKEIKTDTAKPKIRESDGINVAFNKWVNGYTPKNGTPTPVLTQMVQERIRIDG